MTHLMPRSVSVPSSSAASGSAVTESAWAMYAAACAACSSSISADDSDRPVSHSSAETNSPQLIPIRRCTRHTDRSMPTADSAVRHAITCWYTEIGDPGGEADRQPTSRPAR